MDNVNNIDLIKSLAVTAELCGTTLSRDAVKVMLNDLASYKPNLVIAALNKCRKELKGRLTLAEIISRIDDGRPGPEEAWASLPFDEDTSVVWSGEAIEAWGIAYPLISSGDLIAARMTFKEAYAKIVAKARDEMIPVKWQVSLGRCIEGREIALKKAVELGRISHQHADNLLPHKGAAEKLLLIEKST
jgi:hypothetical protein